MLFSALVGNLIFFIPFPSRIYADVVEVTKAEGLKLLEVQAAALQRSLQLEIY
jgi:hypothetical protein